MRPRAQAASGVADPTASITLAKNYDPYGSVIESIGNFTTDYGYADEQMDSSGLVNLRARSYDPSTGRFISQDTWEGDYQNPISLNKWVYGYSNPLKYSDPSGKNPIVGCMVFLATGVLDGEISGIAGCALIFTGLAIAAVIAAQNAPQVEKGVDTACDNFIQSIYNNVREPEPKQTPTPDPQPDPAPQPVPYINQPDVTETPDSNFYFYFKDVGPYILPGRNTSLLIKELTELNVTGMKGEIGQLSATDYLYNNGEKWLEYPLMGRKFESERAIYYARKNELVSMNSTASGYDLMVRNVGPINCIEVKWSIGPIPDQTISNIVADAKSHPSGTYLLESNFIDSRARTILQQKGGIPSPY